jgi:opacity protein-like surface antigen
MKHRSIATVVVAALICLSTSAVAADKKTPDGTVKLSEGSVAAGIGWSWGHGTLTYQGKTYKFKIEGLSIGEVGMTKGEATGNVYDLKSLDDFDGVYGAAGAGIAVQEGKGATALINPKKVQIVLTSQTKGATLKVAAEGLKVKLEK